MGGVKGTCGPHGACIALTTLTGDMDYDCECNFDATKENKYCVHDGMSLASHLCYCDTGSAKTYRGT